MSSTDSSPRSDLWKIWAGAVVVTLVVFVLTLQLVGAPPPDRLRLATGDPEGAYHAAGRAFQDSLAASGITVELVETEGSAANLELLREGSVDAAFVQGGTCTPEDSEALHAIASLGHEALWIFSREPGSTRLTDLAGKRLQVGSAGSGTRALVRDVLAANDMEASTDYVEQGDPPTLALESVRLGEADVAFFVASPGAPRVRASFADPDLHTLSLERSLAYEHHFPYLLPITLDTGALDLAADLPSSPVQLLATTAALLVPQESHPALAPLWIEAARAELSGPGPITLAGTFPNMKALEVPVAPAAEAFFRNGRSFLYRVLPFQVAATVDRLKILLLPLVTLLLPLFRFAPPVYRWRIRRRIFLWYRDVQKIEARTQEGEDPRRLSEELGKLDEEISRVEVPLSYAEELYNLRLHIQLVRTRLDEQAEAGIGST